MVLGLLGNVAGNLNQEAFVSGAEAENRLQNLQRANQNRINRDFFRNAQGGPPALPTPNALNQGSAGLKLDGFGGNYIDIPPPVVEEEVVPNQKPNQKPIPKIDEGPDPDKDGVEQQDGSLEQSDNIELNPASNLKYPTIDPNKIRFNQTA